MEKYRDASGRQVPDATRFPQGWTPVCDFIHGLGMKCGLYTSKSQWTCAGFNASCGKEVIDAATYASWGVDYVKEDSCGSCRNNECVVLLLVDVAARNLRRPSPPQHPRLQHHVAGYPG
jgi:alpha-galactosidase